MPWKVAVHAIYTTTAVSHSEHTTTQTASITCSGEKYEKYKKKTDIRLQQATTAAIGDVAQNVLYNILHSSPAPHQGDDKPIHWMHTYYNEVPRLQQQQKQKQQQKQQQQQQQLAPIQWAWRTCERRANVSHSPDRNARVRLVVYLL